MDKLVELTAEQIDASGLYISKSLNLKRDREHKDRWQTEWGTKTNTGLYLTLCEVMNRIKAGKL